MLIRRLAFFTACLLAVAALDANAQIYRCAGPAGTSFQDTPCSGAAQASSPPGVTRAAPQYSSSGTAAAPVVPLIDDRVEPSSVQYYEVSGSDENGLRASMRAHQPAPGFSGHANWRIEYQYATQVSGNQCRLVNASIKVDGAMQIPRWSDRASAPAELQMRWDRYVAGLKVHENGHLDHGRAMAAELKSSLNGLGAQPSCSVIDQMVHARFDSLQTKYREMDVQYDRDTDHGRTQQAVL